MGGPVALRRAARAVIAAVTLLGCADRRQFREPLQLGGVSVSPEQLEAGRLAYLQYCRACHGERGDGRGPASFGLRPPPRDFTEGKFKFASVESGGLPTDDDLRRIVRRGLAGTAMLAWDVPPTELDAIIAYIKTFSPRWTKGKPGRPVEVMPDPWALDDGAAVTRGRELYHVTAQCSGCHPSYATPLEQEEMMRRIKKRDVVTFREDMFGAVRKDSDYRRGTPPITMRVLPPDFRDDRSIRAGTTLPDLYRVIAAGVGGTAMPAWASTPAYQDAVTGERWDGPRDLWALAHYVRSLIPGRPAAGHGDATAAP